MKLEIKEYHMGDTLVYHPWGKQHGVLVYKGKLTSEQLNKIEDELTNCTGCVSYVDEICTDHKGHYCIRGNHTEDRYVAKENNDKRKS